MTHQSFTTALEHYLSLRDRLVDVANPGSPLDTSLREQLVEAGEALDGFFNDASDEET